MNGKPSPLPHETDPAEVGSRVRARLVDCAFLKLTTRVKYKGRTLTVVSNMTPGKLRTAVFEDGRCVAALSAMGRRAQEFVDKATLDGMETSNHLVEYDLPPGTEPGTVYYPRLVPGELACEVGVFTETWFGSEATPVWFEGTIAASQFKGAEVNGNRTLLKYEQAVEMPTKTVIHTVHIDAHTMDLAQWDTAVVRQGVEEALRSREFLRIEHATTDQDWKWTISVQELVTEALGYRLLDRKV